MIDKMDIEHKIYKLACEGKPGPQIVEEILPTEVKRINRFSGKIHPYLGRKYQDKYCNAFLP